MIMTKNKGYQALGLFKWEDVISLDLWVDNWLTWCFIFQDLDLFNVVLKLILQFDPEHLPHERFLVIIQASLTLKQDETDLFKGLHYCFITSERMKELDVLFKFTYLTFQSTDSNSLILVLVLNLEQLVI